MVRRWNINDPADTALVKELSEAINVNEILARLLIQRNIDTYDKAKTFFRPSLSHLHDPFLMKDMEKAIKRLLEAIRIGEKIMIYGDYDVDGTTSVALVYSYLRRYYPNMEFYIPDRYLEGYGISARGIEYAADAGCHLIISLDCGIKAIKKIDYAKKLGIDFIVCDHHTPGDELPNAVACLDPKQKGCNYPEKDLSGCGVGFKLLQAFCRKMNYSEKHLFEYLDLVAVSIASDIVPITGENRVMAYFGLNKLSKNPLTGLKGIMRIANIENREILISDIIYKIGPRINAAGRIESGRDAVELLISKDEDLANILSQNIDVCNETRRDLDRLTTQEALDIIESSEELKNRKSTVLYKSDWHKGVIGIVASRIIDNYYRPTVILTQNNGIVTGSARSVDGFDLYKAVESCSNLLDTFGGHMYAAGLTMKVENIPEFTKRFEEYVSNNILPDQLIPQIEIDAEISLKDISRKFYRILKQFTPFGPGNPKPVFMSRRVIDYGTSKLVGKEREHIKFELIEEASATIMHGIGFSMAKYFKQIKTGNYFDICYTIEENLYNGKSSIQLMIKDIRFPYNN